MLTSVIKQVNRINMGRSVVQYIFHMTNLNMADFYLIHNILFSVPNEMFIQYSTPSSETQCALLQNTQHIGKKRLRSEDCENKNGFVCMFLHGKINVFLNPFKLKWNFQPLSIGQSILDLGMFNDIFHFYSNFNRTFWKQIVETLMRQPCCGASGLDLHCLNTSKKKDDKLICVYS